MLQKNIPFHLKLLALLNLFLFLNLKSQGFTDSLLYFSTPTYTELIAQYKKLDTQSKFASLIPYGETDGGNTMYLFVITKTGIFDPNKLHASGITVLLINNGIHPGEPDGINASLLLSEQLLANNGENLPQNVAICIIPVMNVEGMLDRGCCSRVNQNGPPEYGFRANALYLDLNRDFIKSDSRNMSSWISIFQTWDPAVLIDTHVSDGADYQYSMSLISSQYNKLYPIQGEYMKDVFSPRLFNKMKDKNSEMCPYVETFRWDLPPDSGMISFLETPRFGSGYAALFNCLGFISEAHMLKPFKERVQATELLLSSVVEICEAYHSEIESKKKDARIENELRTEFPINWALDTSKFDKISFKGYEHGYRISNVTGLKRLYYNRDKPFQHELPLYSTYIAMDTIVAPQYYLIPQAWRKVIELFNVNQIKMNRAENDSLIEADVYYINDYSSPEQPYEGHFLHQNTKVSYKKEIISIRKGDYWVPVNQPGNRYIIETLEPISTDSYFNWGIFDAILQQKEWYSSYAFENLAESILSENPILKNEFTSKRNNDADFASDSFSQLYFIYKNSKYFEKGFKRYPIYRIGLKTEN